MSLSRRVNFQDPSRYCPAVEPPGGSRVQSTNGSSSVQLITMASNVGRAPIAQLEHCRSHPVKPQNIPNLLKDLPNWVIWKAFTEKHDGGFDKVPISRSTGHKVSHLDKNHQMCFQDALGVYQGGLGDGIGISLNSDPVAQNDAGEPLYLIGVDLDKVDGSESKKIAAKSICRALGSYCEISPSGTGVRIFALSKQLLGKGQSSSGEMYHKGRFLTVTGHGRARDVVIATDTLKSLEREWWPQTRTKEHTVNFRSSESTAIKAFKGALHKQDWPETQEKKAEVSKLLDWVTPNTDHETWRDIIWAIASLDWDYGRQALIDWSKGDSTRWSTPEGASEAEVYLHKLYDAFDPDRNVSIGTLFHHAERFGRKKAAFEDGRQNNEEKDSLTKQFNILSRDDLKAMPPAEWLVQGILPTTGVATIYGASMSGKSFIAIDLAIAITNGDATWFNRRIFKRPGLYVALEGGAGIQKRISAWEMHHKKTAPDLKYLIQQFSILDPTHVSNLITQINNQVGEGAVIFIDTLSQATAGSDENSSTDMGRILEAAQHIAQQIEGLVVLIHHTGKDARKGARGHSSFHAAMDAAIEVSRKDQTRYWKTAKVKDGDDNINEAFDLQIVTVGADQYGHPETSCAIRPRSVVFPAIQPKGKNQQVALQEITKLLSDENEVTVVEAQNAAKAALTEVDAGHRAARAKEAIDSLIAAGHINIRGGSITLPKNTGSSP
jgi:hypothetical protein